jgi:hypothetical protein
MFSELIGTAFRTSAKTAHGKVPETTIEISGAGYWKQTLIGFLLSRADVAPYA